MSNESEEEPKLIIDEDWKSQVQREKEELGDAADSSKEEGEAASSEPSDEKSEESVPPPPPANFTFLVTSLATQAMAALGQLPGEDGKAMPPNLDYARHFIDMLGVLDEKTKGNLDENESKFLQETLHQMRMVFVTISQQSGE